MRAREDAVVGVFESHGRRPTAEQVGDLEVIPLRRVQYRDSEFDELDLDAVLARRPAVVLVDELAHTNVPGSRNEKRWQQSRNCSMPASMSSRRSTSSTSSR